MVLWDGSPHQWFGSEYPASCLMAAMDDARGKLLAARFFPFEGSVGYLCLLEQIVLSYGVPGTIYQDRHGALHRNDSHWNLEEQLAGRQEPTQVGLALEALGIRPLFALSPPGQGAGGETVWDPSRSVRGRTWVGGDYDPPGCESILEAICQSIQSSVCHRTSAGGESLASSPQESGSHHQLSISRHRGQRQYGSPGRVGNGYPTGSRATVLRQGQG